jgi:hypothetical protein
MSATLDDTYEYGYEVNHLEENEVMDKYRKEKAAHPDALVVIDDLDCGHWTVRVYRTDKEKEVYYRRRAERMLGKFFDLFST